MAVQRVSAPTLFTFDIFGTVVDWRRGLAGDVAAAACDLADADFDRVIDAQGADEQAGFRPYREITARSLVNALGLEATQAERIGKGLGRWPVFPDAAPGLRALLELAPCVAMSNSDREHGAAVQRTLGFELSNWFCAEDVRVYKPSREFWHAVSQRLRAPFGASWWHVSAYADYDLEAARELGLTTVFVQRSHCRRGPADYCVQDLLELAGHAASAGRG
jgi:2-haloacid dehalogenase